MVKVKNMQTAAQALLRVSLVASLALTLIIATAAPVYAIDADQRRVLDGGAGYFDLTEEEITRFTPGGGGTGGPLVGCDNVQKVYNFFIGQGFTPPQAAGIMGNIQAESGFNPKRVESTSTPDGDKDNITTDGVTGYGLIQWTSLSRQEGLAAYAQSKNLPSGDLQTQLEYIMVELNTSYFKDNTLVPLHAAATLQEAVEVVLVNYETPAAIDIQRVIRTAFATDILARFGGGNGGCATNSSALPV